MPKSAGRTRVQSGRPVMATQPRLTRYLARNIFIARNSVKAGLTNSPNRAVNLYELIIQILQNDPDTPDVYLPENVFTYWKSSISFAGRPRKDDIDLVVMIKTAIEENM